MNVTFSPAWYLATKILALGLALTQLLVSTCIINSPDIFVTAVCGHADPQRAVPAAQARAAGPRGEAAAAPAAQPRPQHPRGVPHVPGLRVLRAGAAARGVLHPAGQQAAPRIRGARYGGIMFTITFVVVT
jgi:hypothetical protein